jgi:hypothetical protein
MGMVHVSSGRDGGFGLYAAPAAIPDGMIPRAVFIKRVLARENQLRLCPETQAEFRKARDTESGWLGVVEQLQRRVAREFGLDEEQGLAMMRSAEALLPGDPDVVELSHYRKYNRCRDGPLRVGDSPPDTALHSVADARTVQLRDLLESLPTKLTVLLAGSYT